MMIERRIGDTPAEEGVVEVSLAESALKTAMALISEFVLEKLREQKVIDISGIETTDLPRLKEYLTEKHVRFTIDEDGQRLLLLEVVAAEQGE